MKQTQNETYERFAFEYLPYQHQMDNDQPFSDKKRHTEVEIHRRNDEVAIFVKEDDRGLSRREKRHNFMDVSFQIRRDHPRKPWFYDPQIIWYKIEIDKDGSEVLYRVLFWGEWRPYITFWRVLTKDNRLTAARAVARQQTISDEANSNKVLENA